MRCRSFRLNKCSHDDVSTGTAGPSRRSRGVLRSTFLYPIAWTTLMLTAAAVLACALDLLGRSPSTVPPIEFVSTIPPGVSRNAQAFLRRDPDVIVFVTSSE